jgi:hypothetical protein
MQSRKFYLAAAALLAFSTGALAQSIVESRYGDPNAPFGRTDNRPNLRCEEAYIQVDYDNCQKLLPSSQALLDELNQRNPGSLESWDSYDLSSARKEQRDISILRAFCARAKKQLDYLKANPDKRC